MLFNTPLVKLFKRLESAENSDNSELSGLISEIVFLGQPAFKYSIKNLNNPVIREYCIRILNALTTEKNFIEIIELLNSHDAKVRESACKIISNLKNDSVYPQLIKMYSGDLTDRLLIGNLLVEKYEKSHFSEILKNLDSDRSEVRRGTMQIIERIGKPEFNQELIKRLKDKDWWLRSNSVRILSDRGVEIDISTIRELLHDTPEVMKKTLIAVQKLREARVVDELILLLFNEDMTIQRIVVDALGAIGNEDVIEKVIEVLGSDNQFAKRGAIEVLNVIGGTETKDTLTRLLRDEDWWVRSRAADTLCEIGGAEVLNIGISLLKEENKELRRIGVEILNNLKAKDSLVQLLDIINDEDWWVKTRAVDAIKGLDEQYVVPKLLDILETDPVRMTRVIQALKHFDLPEVRSTLLNYVNDVDPLVRKEVMQAFIDINAVEAIPQFETLLQDENLKDEALDAIGKLQNKSFSTGPLEGALTMSDIIKKIDTIKTRKEKGLRGSLKDLSLPVLIQMLGMEEKSGHLTLEGETRKIMTVSFNEGRIIDAVAGSNIGEEAFYDILRLKEGNFRFEDSYDLPNPTIEKPTQSLLMDGLRIIDEENK